MIDLHVGQKPDFLRRREPIKTSKSKADIHIRIKARNSLHCCKGALSPSCVTLLLERMSGFRTVVKTLLKRNGGLQKFCRARALSDFRRSEPGVKGADYVTTQLICFFLHWTKVGSRWSQLLDLSKLYSFCFRAGIGSTKLNRTIGLVH